MVPISQLNSSCGTVMAYRFKGCCGVMISWSHGRMQWYREDTKYYVDLSDFQYFT